MIERFGPLFLGSLLVAAACTSRPEGTPRTEPADPLPRASDNVPVGLPPANGETPPQGVEPAMIASARATLLPQGASRVDEVRSVVLGLDVQYAKGTRPVAVEIRTPGGVQYERRTVQLEGRYEQVAHVETELPVAGTVISVNALAGTWSARFFVDESPVATTTFELR